MRHALRALSGRAFATALAALLVTLSFAQPLLDRGEWTQQQVIESEHDAALCVRGHDHTICTQYGADRSLAGSPPRHQTAAVSFTERPASRQGGFHFSLRHSPHASRAPPQV